MDKQAEQLMRDTAASLCCDMLTDAPYQMGDLRIEKVGFAEIPVVFVTVACPREAISAIVPVARQFIFRELAAAGIENEIVELRPRLAQNDGSGLQIVTNTAPPRGRTRWAAFVVFAFEIKRPFLGYFRVGRVLQTGGKDTRTRRDGMRLGGLSPSMQLLTCREGGI